MPETAEYFPNENLKNISLCMLCGQGGGWNDVTRSSHDDAYFMACSPSYRFSRGTGMSKNLVGIKGMKWAWYASLKPPTTHPLTPLSFYGI